MTLSRATDVPRLPPRKPEGHKGSYGRVLVVAGSRGMSGAAVLCGSAALRGGAGLVTVACPDEILDVVAAGNPCYTTVGLTSPGTTDLRTRGPDYDVIAIGPGLGYGPDKQSLVRTYLAAYPEKPLVLDADGLNNLDIVGFDNLSRQVPAVLTPHPGELATLTGKTTNEVQANREPLAVEFAARHKVVLLLKGNHTIVTDGARVYTNQTGNPGMATGGCGDVLTGLIAALLGQKLSPFDAACLGAWAHGRAGDIAAAEVGQAALIASDLLAYLGKALREVES
ncbi:NAD(P)H-hydrate dehydratase [Limnoglobus roseus]|uniref:ADP-dependent (S)-NAD(P)H-hydrate dehydratase n=1 Tax=Limnoglobus roseus TaxID=2598579 RepID=A0A5C1ANG4_9BACT|nr:NAD(P)H-hydrate dehydratase [Limnoglobus roseus]QEL20949.1 NAD(P)H-hydrate dehydratase [Limnoglobus roseus]